MLDVYREIMRVWSAKGINWWRNSNRKKRNKSSPVASLIYLAIEEISARKD
jgi:hypothetical protein